MRSPSRATGPSVYRSFGDDQSLNTPRANRPQSSLSARPPSTIGKRSGTAAYEYIRRHEVPTPFHGGHRFKGAYKGAPVAEDFDLVLPDEGDEHDDSFEGLENVRGESPAVSAYVRR